MSLQGVQSEVYYQVQWKPSAPINHPIKTTDDIKQSQMCQWDQMFLTMIDFSSQCEKDGKINNWRPLINSEGTAERKVSYVIQDK